MAHKNDTYTIAVVCNSARNGELCVKFANDDKRVKKLGSVDKNEILHVVPLEAELTKPQTIARLLTMQFNDAIMSMLNTLAAKYNVEHAATAKPAAPAQTPATSNVIIDPAAVPQYEAKAIVLL